MTKRIKWPKEVPHLEAKHICRNRVSSPGGKHCLLGWAAEASGGDSRVYDRLEVALHSEVGHGEFDVIDFNDSPRNTLSEVAAVWNRAMAKLGYTEVD